MAFEKNISDCIEGRRSFHLTRREWLTAVSNPDALASFEASSALQLWGWYKFSKLANIILRQPD